MVVTRKSRSGTPGPGSPGPRSPHCSVKCGNKERHKTSQEASRQSCKAYSAICVDTMKLSSHIVTGFAITVTMKSRFLLGMMRNAAGAATRCPMAHTNCLYNVIIVCRKRPRLFLAE